MDRRLVFKKMRVLLAFQNPPVSIPGCQRERFQSGVKSKQLGTQIPAASALEFDDSAASFSILTERTADLDVTGLLQKPS